MSFDLGPCLLHGAPLALDLVSQLAPESPLPMVSTVVPLALYLGAPLALEAQKALDFEGLIAPCSFGSRSGTPDCFMGLIVFKGAHWLWGPPRALVTDEKILGP